MNVLVEVDPPIVVISGVGAEPVDEVMGGFEVDALVVVNSGNCVDLLVEVDLPVVVTADVGA